MIICINNYLESATITANEGSEFFPVENLYSPTLYGNNGVTQYTGNIVIDLGSAKNVKTIGLMRSSASVTVEANTSDSWATPAYSISMDKDVKKIDQTYRYWRIVTTDVGAQFIGQFYLGLPIIPEYVSHGSLPQVETSDVENFTATGAYFATKGVDRLVQSFAVTCATKDEYETWYNYWRSDERKKPVIFCQFEETIDNVFPVYFGRIAFSTDGRDRFNYRFNFDLIEVS